MRIVFACHCGQMLSAPDDQAGRPMACPRCNAQVVVPLSQSQIGPVGAPVSPPQPAPPTPVSPEQPVPVAQPVSPEQPIPMAQPMPTEQPVPTAQPIRPQPVAPYFAAPPAGYPRMPAYVGPRTCGTAIASLVLGILGPLTIGICAWVAVLLGHHALREIKRAEGQLTGKGFALAGLILGYVVGVPILAFAVAVFIHIVIMGGR